MFTEITSNTEKLSKCFKNNSPLNSQICQWEKSFKSCVAQSFKKIRISDKVKITESHMLMEKRIMLKNKSKLMDDQDEVEEVNEEIHNIEKQLSNLMADENTKKVKDNLSVMSEIDGSFNAFGFWKVKNKFFPKHGKSLPVSKVDFSGRLISNPAELMQLYTQTYVHRLRHRPIKPELE